MKNLSLSHPFFNQIQAAKTTGLEFVIDMRSEAQGDKVAHLNFAFWLSKKIGKITLIEARGGRTPFMLSDYILPENIECVVSDVYGQYDMEDYPAFCLNGIGDKDYLWILNYYLCTQQIRAPFIPKVIGKSNDILFCPQTNLDYDQRREWDIPHTAKTFEMLRQRYGKHVRMIWDKEHPLMPYAEKFSMTETVEMLYAAKLVIAGDTGFSHVRGAMGLPLISLYPDWSLGRFDRQGTRNRIAEWFDLPLHLCHRSCYPNVDFKQWKLVELGTDHKFSTEHLFQSIEHFVK